MLEPPDFWFFLIASFFLLICLDLATPSTAGAYSSYPNISKGKRFPSVDCDMLLIAVLPKQNSFFWYTHNTLFTSSHVESLM